MSSKDEISPATTISSSPIPKLSSPAHQLLHGGPPPFVWSSLWNKPVINHLNGKSYTLPIFNLTTAYGRNFHLAWLGFFVAFLSWFSFPPLIPEAIKTDLNLTPAQIGNSNIIALCATLVVRFALGPVVDRYGPRVCMAAILIAGAIPSGLAGTATTVNGFYVIRFFIGILGGTFVPCQAWTTAFFDKNIVGTANAFAGGFGNLGGGVTFVVITSAFQSIISHGMSDHNAWRVAIASVSVPILLGTAALTLIFGTDCPAGKWSTRHTLPASALAAKMGHLANLDADEKRVVEAKMAEKEQGHTRVQEAEEDEDEANATTDLDIAVAEHLTWSSAYKIAALPYTWLPALMYMTTFGFELAVDANLSNVFYATHASSTFTQLQSGYYASIFGFLNLVTRPAGGLLGDLIYVKYGVKGKKYITILLGFLQGAMSLGMGLYMKAGYASGNLPDLNTQVGFIVLMAFFCEVANGTNFSLVPHCNSFNNGFMTGLVGAFGNLGGIIFAVIFRFQSAQAFAAAWWISGIFAMAVNALCIFIPAPPM